MLQWDKTCVVRHPQGQLVFQNDRGPRISVQTFRTMEAEPDTAQLRIWNLPRALSRYLAQLAEDLRQEVKKIQLTVGIDDLSRANQMKQALDRAQIEILAGFGRRAQLIFRGDPLEVHPHLRDGNDTFTQLRLGDASMVLGETNLLTYFSPQQTPANVISWVLGLVDLTAKRSDIEARVGQVAPNALIEPLPGGFFATGRPMEAISTFAEFYATRFWVRDGTVHIIPRDGVLKDYAVELDGSKNLIELSDLSAELTHSFRALASPALHPGRGVRVLQAGYAPFNARVTSVELILDTHGQEWYASGVLSRVEFISPNLLKPG